MHSEAISDFYLRSRVTSSEIDGAQPSFWAVETEMTPSALKSRPISKSDFDQIVTVMDKWWEGPTSALAHPMFFHELGEDAMIVENADGRMVGFLLGFFMSSKSMGYIHLVGIDPEFRRHGVGRLLYAAFEERARQRECRELKAVTNTGNEGSVRFHEALGWSVKEETDYAGPGRNRLVFRKSMASN